MTMTDPYRLPKGVTYQAIAKQFKEGKSVYDLATRYQCFVGTIEDAIREVIKRQRGTA